MIRLALVDDDDLMRVGLTLLFEQAPGISVVAEASDGEEAIVVARRDRPDVMLVDVRMPTMTGIEATEVISALEEAPRVVILTTFENDAYVFDALRAGASGFLLKRTPAEELVAAVHTVAAGESLLSPSVTRTLIAAFVTTNRSRPEATVPGLSTLTERETEILVTIASGLSNREIAATLFIAESTVKTHVKRILMKLGARDRAQAVIAAYEGGLMG